MDDLEPNKESLKLTITFTVVKKRKKTRLAARRAKQLDLRDIYVQHILRYYIWMKNHHPECKYLFPSTRSIFGQSLFFYKDKHLSGRQILRIVDALNPRAWVHLFRETEGAEVVKKDPTVIGVFKVMRRLDLDSEEAAWRYIRRYATDVIEYEEKQKKKQVAEGVSTK